MNTTLTSATRSRASTAELASTSLTASCAPARLEHTVSLRSKNKRLPLSVKELRLSPSSPFHVDKSKFVLCKRLPLSAAKNVGLFSAT